MIKNKIESFLYVIKIFDHFPDHTHVYTILIIVTKKLEFPGLSVDGKKKKRKVKR